MPIPVIDPTTSIWGFRQYQDFEIQPSATNSPTSWACSPLPTGVSINGTTGKITGAGTVAGVTTANLTATNGSGTSAALVVTFGIKENSQLGDQMPAFAIDMQTGAIARSDGVAIPAGQPLFWLKEGDVQGLVFQFYNFGQYIDFNPTSLKLTLKQYEPESGVVSAGGATLGTHFKKIGTGEQAAWILIIDVSSAALAGVLGGVEADAGTFFYAIAEVEAQWPNPFGIGAGTLVRSTRTFVVGVERDLVA